MLRHVSLLALVLAASMACDQDPEQPRGGAWQPCTKNFDCSDAALGCFEVFGSPDVSACLPDCVAGDTCAAAPPTENGVPAATRCAATGSNPGLCVVDCTTTDNCPAGMLCFFDNVQTPLTNLGICAWPPA